jgi:hypothetical protein
MDAPQELLGVVQHPVDVGPFRGIVLDGDGELSAVEYVF